MTAPDHDGTPASPGSDELAWADFEQALAAYLSAMDDPDDQDHLILETPGDDVGGAAPYAQFAGCGDGEILRAELSGNAYLAPQFLLDDRSAAALHALGWRGGEENGGDDERNWYLVQPLEQAPCVAALVVQALRHTFGLPHPHLLLCRAWGPASERINDLGLAAADDLPTDVVDLLEPLTQEIATYPDGTDGLASMVGEALRTWFLCEPVVDDDGDFVLTHLDQPVWVRARGDRPSIEVTTCVVHDVSSPPRAAIEIGLLNRDHEDCKWILRDRDVWQTTLIPGWPFVVEHLKAAIALFLNDMTATRDDLVLRTGGRVA